VRRSLGGLWAPRSTGADRREVGPGRGWTVEHRSGTAGSLCATWPPPEQAGRRVVATCVVTEMALVLGSTQREEVVAMGPRAKGEVALARRPAGGGAVLVDRGAQLWIDFWLPRDDGLWEDDVVGAAVWAGEAWAAALESLGVIDLEVHRGRCVATSWSSLVCFAGLGPGEVSVAGAKVVGLAQRRTRDGARFMSVANMSWDPARILGFLDLEDDRGEDAAVQLAHCARGIDELIPRGSGVDPAGGGALLALLESALHRALP